MKDIPPDGIYYDDALIIVAQKLDPDAWQILEERLDPASSYYDAFPDRDTKEAAAREIERAYIMPCGLRMSGYRKEEAGASLLH